MYYFEKETEGLWQLLKMGQEISALLQDNYAVTFIAFENKISSYATADYLLEGATLRVVRQC